MTPPVGEKFGAYAHSWLDQHAPRGNGAGSLSGAPQTPPSIEEQKRFQRALHEAGLAGITWPREYGGQGLTDVELAKFRDAARDYVLPVGAFIIGLGMPGETLLECGSEEQRRRYLPRMIRGEEIWCQLFSEPSAGSDVASLQTTAMRDGDGWVINGQKVWTSGAEYSDLGMLVARTDSSRSKHAGLTMFIVDMRSPGITVRPLRVATGEAPFNEVFFDNVRLPAESVVGEVDEGWRVVVAGLRHEREQLGTLVQSDRRPLSSEQLRELAGQLEIHLTESQRLALARLAVQETACRIFGEALRAQLAAGLDVGSRGSVAKLTQSACMALSVDVAAEVLGSDLGRTDDPRLAAVVREALETTGMSIAGGTDEIQRNIIAERVLGQPKDLGSDRNAPFNRARSNGDDR